MDRSGGSFGNLASGRPRARRLDVAPSLKGGRSSVDESNMRPQKRTSPVWLVLSLLGACSGGSSSPATTVGQIAAPRNAGGDVELEFTLESSRSVPADVELTYSPDGGTTWYLGTVASGSTRSLASSPGGTRHKIVWDSLADVGFRTPDPIMVGVVADESGNAAVTPAKLSSEKGASSKQSAKKPKKHEPIEIDNLPVAARRIESYLYYLGPLDSAQVAIAETHDLVILTPSDPSVTPAVIAEIQNGVDGSDPADDVIVLGYANIGQDPRTASMSDAAMAADPRFVGDGSGPRIDPRGPDADGMSLLGIDPAGKPAVAGGYAAWYLDDNSVDADGVGDGLPDRSGINNACYVNAGVPEWFDTVNNMVGAVDGVAGLREIITQNYGDGFGCDGVFLDRVDTCSPNSFTATGDPNQVEFEWTAPGFASFIAATRSTYPKSVVMQNRGLFFFNPDRPHYMFSTGKDIDYVTFASYRLDADASRPYDPYFFADNKFNIAPRLQVEANRPGGFQVLSIGHAAGPGIDPLTLVGQSTDGFSTLLQDIAEAQQYAGFRHYLTDGSSHLVNDFVAQNSDFDDHTPPRWTSTYNTNNPGWPQPPMAPAPRIGVQEAIAGSSAVTLRWDVALDLHPVHYVLYYDDRPIVFDKSGKPKAKRRRLAPELGAGYEFGPGPGTFPYQQTIAGLSTDTDYWFVIRARDSRGNEDDNRVVLRARTLTSSIHIAVDGDFADWDMVPMTLVDGNDAIDSAGPDWLGIKVYNDSDNLYVYFESDNAFNLDGSPAYPYSRTLICLDVDNNPFTGWAVGSVGSEIAVAGDALYRQSGSVFADTFLQLIAVNPTTNVEKCELAIPLRRLDDVYGLTTTRLRIMFVNDDVWDAAPDSGHLDFNLVR